MIHSMQLEIMIDISQCSWNWCNFVTDEYKSSRGYWSFAEFLWAMNLLYGWGEIKQIYMMVRVSSGGMKNLHLPNSLIN
jgi:hypothetical protein